jgi:hypothetical protein
MFCTGSVTGFSHDVGLDGSARIDLGLALGRVGTFDENIAVFERLGYFEQYYWSEDKNIIFSKPLGEPKKFVII